MFLRFWPHKLLRPAASHISQVCRISQISHISQISSRNSSLPLARPRASSRTHKSPGQEGQMPWKRYCDTSLHPPTHPPRHPNSALPPWVLLDKRAYIANGSNHTTAVSRTRDGDEIQATFFLADAPLVSYFCVSCTAEFSSEPSILSTEANLVLLFVVHGSPSNLTRPEMHDFYVYQADGGPSLTLLPQPPPALFPYDRGYYFHERQVGLLRYRTNSDGGGRFIPRPHGPRPYDAYIVAALCTQQTSPETFRLYTYDSNIKAWSSEPALFLDDQLPESLNLCDTVITIGGEAGTMGWVDLMRGIILCDVLPLNSIKKHFRPIKKLHYIPVPPPILERDLDESLSMYRDIAVVGDRIKYVEVQMHFRPASCRNRGCFTSDGWTAVTWSRSRSRTVANSVDKTGWRKDYEVHAHEVSSVDGNNNTVAGVELLPTLRDDQGTPQPTLERIHVGHPKLSLRDGDHTVYLMAKIDRRYKEAWVIALDMSSKRLRGVAEYGGAQRSLSFINVYNHSRISEHLNVAQGTKGQLKRPGMPLPGSSRKKLPELPLHVAMAMQHYYGGQDPTAMQHTSRGQKQQDADGEEASAGDDDWHNMDLE